MAREDLEKVVKARVKPIIDSAMQKFIGARIVEMENDLSDRLANPLLDMEIDTSLGFRKAKQKFRKQYLSRLIQASMGNISKAADSAGIDRRSIHRLVSSMKIDAESIRDNLIGRAYVQEDRVRDIIEGTLGEYRAIISPKKMKKMYGGVAEISKDIIRELPQEPLTLKEAEEEFEKRFISKAMQENGMNASKAARSIGLRYETLHRKMKALGICQT